MKIGKGIKIARKSREITQEKLAEIAGCSTTHIAQIEGGFAYPSIQMVEKIAKALQVSPAQFYPLFRDPLKSELAQHLLNLIGKMKVDQIKKIIEICKLLF